jgi:hypothetical protein
LSLLLNTEKNKCLITLRGDTAPTRDDKAYNSNSVMITKAPPVYNNFSFFSNSLIVNFDLKNAYKNGSIEAVFEVHSFPEGLCYKTFYDL